MLVSVYALLVGLLLCVVEGKLMLQFGGGGAGGKESYGMVQS